MTLAQANNGEQSAEVVLEIICLVHADDTLLLLLDHQLKHSRYNRRIRQYLIQTRQPRSLQLMRNKQGCRETTATADTQIEFSKSLPLQDTTFTSLKSLLNILKCSTREFSLAPNVLFFVLLLPICMF